MRNQKQETKGKTFANVEMHKNSHICYKMVELNQYINFSFFFFFADVNDNWKLRLNKPLECNKYPYSFNSLEDLEDIFYEFG